MALAGVIALLTLAVWPALRAESPSLQVQRGAVPGTVTLSGSGSADGSHRVELSTGLEGWWPVHAISDAAQWSWDWDEARDLQEGFFRLVDAVPPVIAPHASWKSEVTLPGDEFLSEPLSGTGTFFTVEMRWVKFALIIDALPEVYFQKSADYPEWHKDKRPSRSQRDHSV